MRFTFTPFSARDIVAHIIPGAILLVLALWFLDAFVGLIINLLTLGTGVVSLVMWLLAAYATGVFLHLFVRFFTGQDAVGHETALAQQMLADGDSRLTAEFKKELAARAQKKFGFAVSGKELYRLCSDYVSQHCASGKAESLSAFAEMYRGIQATAKLGIAVSLLIVLKHIVLLLLPQFNIIMPVTGFLDYETLHLVIGLAMLIVFGFSMRLLRERVHACTEEAVSDVYTSFVALSADNAASIR